MIEDQLIGAALLAARKAAGVLQEDAARAVGVTVRTFGRYERGERPFPATHLRPLAQALGLTPGELAAAIWRSPDHATADDASSE